MSREIRLEGGINDAGLLTGTRSLWSFSTRTRLSSHRVVFTRRSLTGTLTGRTSTARASSTLDSVFSCRLVAGAVEGGFLAAGTLCLCSADAAAARVGFAAG